MGWYQCVELFGQVGEWNQVVVLDFFEIVCVFGNCYMGIGFGLVVIGKMFVGGGYFGGMYVVNESIGKQCGMFWVVFEGVVIDYGVVLVVEIQYWCEIQVEVDCLYFGCYQLVIMFGQFFGIGVVGDCVYCWQVYEVLVQVLYVFFFLVDGQ